MKRFPATSLLLLFVIFAWVSGCGRTQPSRFYTLNAMPVTAMPDLRAKKISVGVGPISIPDYLERPQIVTRSGANRILLGDFDKWAGGLRENIAGVIAANLSTLLKTDRVTVFPGRGPEDADVRIPVQFSNFEAVLGENAWLDARWRITADGGRKLLRTERTRLNIRLNGADYETVVAGQSRLLEALSKEIAEAVQELAQSPKEQMKDAFPRTQ